MVQLSKSTVRKRRPARRGGGADPGGLVTYYEWARLLGVAVLVTILVSFLLPEPEDPQPVGEEGSPLANLRHAKELSRIADLSPEYNAIAQDVLRTLDCSSIKDDIFSMADDFTRTESGWNGLALEDLGEGEKAGGVGVWGEDGWKDVKTDGDGGGDNLGGWGFDRRRRRRRLQTDDFVYENPDVGIWDSPYSSVTATHLMCLAAGSTELHDKAKLPNAYGCDAAGEKRKPLLDLWDTARALMPEDLLKTSLDLAVEYRDRDLQGHNLNIWAPQNDEGIKYMFQVVLKGEKTYSQGGMRDLEKKLGAQKIFVDVGSGIGLTALAIQFMYPGTAILAIEPASPTWLMQGLNFKCNLDKPQRNLVHSILAGVGPKNDHMAKMMWRPEATTSTRSWTPKEFDLPGDIELVVRLRKIRSILAEGMPDDLPLDSKIDVMNIDCEGCEYDLIPSLTDADFHRVGIMIGSMHWGFIPYEKKPSSERARLTHEKLCRHQTFVNTAKECCAFPDQKVTNGFSWSDDEATTVSELAGEFCDGFEDWAATNHLFDIDNNFGWLELSAEAGTSF